MFRRKRQNNDGGSFMKINAKQLIAINKRGLSFDARDTTWNQHDNDLVAVKIEEQWLHLWIFAESGDVYTERIGLDSNGWEIEGWSGEHND